MQLVQRPEEYDVLVLPNLYGDIISDLCAGLIGGPRASPRAPTSATTTAVFEATHGSAPKYKGMNKVNPMAMMLSGVLMLRHLDEIDAADRLEAALAAVIEEGKSRHLRHEAQPRRPDRRRHQPGRRRGDREAQRLDVVPTKVVYTGRASLHGLGLRDTEPEGGSPWPMLGRS